MKQGASTGTSGHRVRQERLACSERGKTTQGGSHSMWTRRLVCRVSTRILENLDQLPCRGGCGRAARAVAVGMQSRCILEVEPTRLSDGLDVGTKEGVESEVTAGAKPLITGPPRSSGAVWLLGQTSQ